MPQTAQQAITQILWGASKPEAITSASQLASDVIDGLKDRGFAVVDLSQFKKPDETPIQILQPGDTSISIRDWFAGQALGLMMRDGIDMMLAYTQNSDNIESAGIDEIINRTTRIAYRISDAMLKAREGK